MFLKLIQLFCWTNVSINRWEISASTISSAFISQQSMLNSIDANLHLRLESKTVSRTGFYACNLELVYPGRMVSIQQNFFGCRKESEWYWDGRISMNSTSNKTWWEFCDNDPIFYRKSLSGSTNQQRFRWDCAGTDIRIVLSGSDRKIVLDCVISWTLDFLQFDHRRIESEDEWTSNSCSPPSKA